MNQRQLVELQYLISQGNLKSLKTLFDQYQQIHNYKQNNTYFHTFRLLFLNASLNGKTDIAKWLYNDVYSKLSLDEQMKLQPVFHRALQYASLRKNHKNLKEWLQRILLLHRDKYINTSVI